MTFAKSGTTVTLTGGSASIIGATEITIAPHQNVIQFENASVGVRDRAVREWFISLRFRCSNTTRSSLRSFLISTIEFQRYTFTFTPDATVDAGAGAGTAVTVNYWQGSYSEKYVGYDRWECSMILRTTSSGTGSPS